MNHKTKEQLIAFETRIKDIFQNGELPFLIHLSGGNEEQLIRIFQDVKDGDWILSGHRSHYHYLLAGGDPAYLESEIRTGRSMFIFDKKINFLTSSILAGLCCVGAGIAWNLKRNWSPNRVWCFVGDGGADEGHLFEAIRFVEGWDLPCNFIIEDNNRSVDTTPLERNGPRQPQWVAQCATRYFYTPTYPHGGAGCKTMVAFKPEIVAKFKA